MACAVAIWPISSAVLIMRCRLINLLKPLSVRISTPGSFSVRDLYRVYAKLHQALRPYLLEQAEYSCKTGTPLLRHLFLYDPKDPDVVSVEDEYMLGEALLVAPVFSPSELRDIYLPRGNWRNILDGKSYQGGRTLNEFPVPMRQIPVFLLEGNASRTINGVLKDAEGLLDRLR